MTEIEIKDKVIEAIQSKKGKKIVVLDLAEMTTIADYFVICSATSTTQVRGIANGIDEALSTLAQDKLEPLRREGITEGKWAVIDYGSVIVHIFEEQTREMYNLDSLWSQGTNLTEIAEN